jgi:hypothetical protein
MSKLTEAKVEPGTVRICPMRDGPCPHGIDCEFVGDGPYGYPCKDGWLKTPAGRQALEEREGRDE